MSHISLSTLAKYGFMGVITAFSLIGMVFAANRITSLSQTAATGDAITAEWVNAVNTALAAQSNGENSGGGVGQCHEFSTAQEANAILENHTRMPSTIQIKRLSYYSSDIDIDMKFYPQSVVRWINAQYYSVS